MSFWVEDANGYCGDIASNLGLAEMRKSAPPSLKKFLNTGEADADLAEKILSEIVGKEVFAHVAEILKGAKPPLVLTDGAKSEGEE